MNDHPREIFGLPVIPIPRKEKEDQVPESAHLREVPAESDKTIASSPRITNGHELTDLGNAERLVELHGEDIKFTTALGWMFYDGRRWCRDEGDKQVQIYAASVARGIRMEAARQLGTDQFKKVAKHAGRSESAPRIRAMIDLARPMLQINADIFDRNEALLNVENGVVDLFTGELRPHDRSDMLSQLSPVEFDPGESCPIWLRFLDEIFDSDSDLIAFVQRAAGYSLTASVKEQCFFLLHGVGANGKSTLVNVLRALVGSYGKTTPFTTFNAPDRGSNGPRDDLAALAGVRFVAASEGEAGRRLDEATIKNLTGGETITARHLYKALFEYVPKFKIWLSTNHAPTIRGTDEAIWRRIRRIPFEVAFPEGKRDPDLGERLKSELSGILNWAISGCLEWRRQGLAQPDVVRAAVQEYREEQDRLGGFLSACVVSREGEWTSSADLFKVYQDWCNKNGERATSQRTLGTQLKERGFGKKDTSRARGWADIMVTE